MNHTRHESPGPGGGYRLYRSRTDSVFFGVCGGIAEHFDFSPWGVRFFFLLMMIPTFFWTVIVYIALAMFLKPAPPRRYRTYESEEFWNSYQTSRHDALRKVDGLFRSLDQRLQRMETVVTRPDFDLRDRYRDLDS